MRVRVRGYHSWLKMSIIFFTKTIIKFLRVEGESIDVHDRGKIIRWCNVQVDLSLGSNKDHVNSLWVL
jgi:hypothetical protein